MAEFAAFSLSFLPEQAESTWTKQTLRPRWATVSQTLSDAWDMVTDAPPLTMGVMAMGGCGVLGSAEIIK